MITASWIAALAALFLWWFSTGAILLVVRLSAGGRGRATLWSLPFLGGGLAGLAISMSQTDIASIYLGFASALAIWGWIELAFLTGIITGPNAYPCPPDSPPFERFIRAWGTIAYHECLLVLIAIALCLLSWDQPNPIGAWCFGILFVARVSAKLNLFFGVPRFNVEFLPAHLAHLPSHFRIARMNWFFPISVTILSALVAWFIARAGHAETAAAAASQVLLATLSALALLEHWLLVLPLPDAKLWRWMLPEQKQVHMNAREERHGI
ncbi:MAG: putative photosynthetic complex assembly protein PuhE [Pseudomonadota bacterium]